MSAEATFDLGTPRRIGADAWFDGREAAEFDLLEQSYPLPANQICTILAITNPKMLRE